MWLQFPGAQVGGSLKGQSGEFTAFDCCFGELLLKLMMEDLCCMNTPSEDKLHAVSLFPASRTLCGDKINVYGALEGTQLHKQKKCTYWKYFSKIETMRN